MPDDPIVATPPASPPATPETVPAAAPATTPPPSRRDIIEQAFKTPRTRDEAGRYAPQPPAAPGAPVFPKPGAPAIPARPAMPKSWNKEFESHWNTAPVELLNRFVQREEEMHRGVEPLQTRAREADDILNEFKPYEMMLRTEGATPKQAIANLLQTAALLRTGTPQQKAILAAQMIRQFNVPVEGIQQALSGALPPPSQPAVDPQFSQLAQQVQRLTEAQQQESTSRAMNAIEQFSKDPGHKHFEAVQDRMLTLLQSPQVLGDTTGKSEADKLQLAYDLAIWQDPQIRQLVLAEQQTAAAAASPVAKARNAAVQVHGAPQSSPAVAVDPKDRRAIIANAMRAQR